MPKQDAQQKTCLRPKSSHFVVLYLTKLSLFIHRENEMFKNQGPVPITEFGQRQSRNPTLQKSRPL